MFYLFSTTWKYADKDKWKLMVCYILHTISICGLLLQPYAFGMAINTLQKNGIHHLLPAFYWLGLYLLGFILFQIFHRSGRYFEISTAIRNQQRFINAIYSKLYKLPLKWHVDHHSGVIVNQIKVAGEAFNDFGCSQSNFLEHIILSIGPIIVLAGINIRITVISLLLIAINLLIVFRLNRSIQSILDKITENYHTFSGKLADFTGNIRTVLTLGLGKQTKVELNSRFDRYYEKCMAENSINQIRCMILDIGALLIEIAAVAYYIWSLRLSRAVFLIGNLVMIITYLRQMRDAVFEIASSFYDTMRWKSAIKSTDTIMGEPSRYYAAKTENGLPSWTNIIIKNLEFVFGQNQFKMSITDLYFSSNSKVAVIGTSGSGKSTLLHLLSGLYEPDSLELVIDGIIHKNIHEISRSTSLISQDIEIFENTILFNITFGMEPEQHEISKAINSARLDEVIEKLPNGIDTDIREKGINLSGGEKQRLALARGLYFSKAKDILLFDEITSSVDAVNERLIMEQILGSYDDKCIICNIHRLHLLDMFDMVLVMDNGQIVEKGTFSELLNSNGNFKILWDKYQIETAATH